MDLTVIAVAAVTFAGLAIAALPLLMARRQPRGVDLGLDEAEGAILEALAALAANENQPTRPSADRLAA